MFHPDVHSLMDDEFPLTFDCCICRARTCNPPPGWWEKGVCSQACYDEKLWREALAVTRHRYRRNPSAKVPR